MVRHLILCAVLCARITAQSSPVRKPVQGDPTQQKIALLEKRVHELEKSASAAGRPSDATSQITSLEKTVRSLETRLQIDELLLQQKQDRAESVQLDPSSRNFSRIDSDSSSFLVMVEDATPYLDGYRVKLKIGNPNDADFLNVKVKVRWSKSYDWKKYNESTYASWQKAIHEKEITINERVKAGAWTPVSIDLTPCSADEMGYLEVSLKSPTIALE